MNIPKIISKNNHEYILVKVYPNHVMYMDILTHTRECFTIHELGMIKEMVKPPRSDLNVEKVKF